jgi:organic hydroperoxide reductase OsmC/OhrA
MENEHTYRVVAWWSSGKSGLAKSDSAPNAIHFAAPPQFGGLQARWSPEDLLLCALASCFTTTFRALAEYSRFEYTDLQVEVSGTVCKVESGYAFQEITLWPTLILSCDEGHAQADRLLHKAKLLCLISRALAVVPAFEPRVEVKTAKIEVADTVLVG